MIVSYLNEIVENKTMLSKTGILNHSLVLKHKISFSVVPTQILTRKHFLSRCLFLIQMLFSEM